MKMTTGLLVLVLCVSLTGSALGNEHKEQSLYFNLGIGGASASYQDELQDMVDILEDLPGISHLQVGFDLGLYFPLRPGSLLGFAITGIGDRFEEGSDHLQLNQYLYAASYRYYPSKMTGKGFFVRGDVGLAKVVMDISGLGSESSDSGTGVLFGGGYSWQIGGSTWFSLNADYTTKSIEDETVGGVTVSGAFLF